MGDEEVKPSFGEKVSTGCSSFCHFLYNKDNGQVMGRSGRSWAKIGVFYLFFYGFLTAFFSAMLAAFLSTVDRPEDGGAPKLTQFIENQPGLTRLDKKFLLGGYKASDNKTYLSYANNLISIFEGIQNSNIYKGPCNQTMPTPTPTSNNTNTTAPPPDTRPCYAAFDLYGPCQPDPTDIKKSLFGLSDKKPCVFIKVNKVFGWVPKVSSPFLKLRCTGSGIIGQHPEGFLIEGFPFKGGKGHHLPFVAVQVDASKSVNVKCYLSDSGMKVSDSYNPSRSYGNLEIKGISSS